jgi:hypothetical protein
MDDTSKMKEKRFDLGSFTLDGRTKSAAPLSGAEEQTARAISAYAQCACLFYLQMGSMN